MSGCAGLECSMYEGAYGASNKKYALVFNQTCINEELLPNYINIKLVHTIWYLMGGERLCSHSFQASSFSLCCCSRWGTIVLYLCNYQVMLELLQH
jgi:hypothetical protein